MISPQFVHQL